MNRRILTGLILMGLLLSGAVGALAQEGDATIMLGGNDELGDFLVGQDGMTLYLFTNDEPGVSNCYDQCAENWPPLVLGEEEQPSLAAGLPGWLSVLEREDGTRQVAYNGMPLYYFVRDEAPGDATGEGVNDVWFVVRPPLVSLGGNNALGDFLVDGRGMTLYLFTNDEPGVSNCYDQCAENWPPLTVESADALAVQPGLIGEFGTTERDDGTLQVTYDGMPLYYFVRDEAPGDANGQGVNDVWFVVSPPDLSIGGSDELGEFVVGPNGMTLYMFTNDEGGVSACYDQCAVNWPPLLAGSDVELTAAEGVTGTLGTTERDDGTLQITLNGMPLYYWIRDHVPGDATGQNVGERWFVVSPAGEIIQ